ncbi:MAG: MerR family transcriptional regulator [Candidatus Peribacteria bacterium]|nr:MerR family transcriptional regulator [Candidatus Peribacteria bacterium]
MRQITALAEASEDPAGAHVQQPIARHYNGLRHFYDPNLHMYRGLADTFVADPRFAAYYDKYKPGLALFMKNAMVAFCDTQANLPAKE